jgi:phosphohistidine phosphatase SixA
MAPAGHLVDPVLNLVRYRREHEKFYEQAPLEDAVLLQRHSGTRKTLADRWQHLTPALDMPGPSLASAHATSGNGQVAATPALMRRTAARRTAIKANLRGSRLLLLVRHAHAGDKHRWQGPDSRRPLSLAGQAEAAGLVIGLEDYPIGRILTSPTLRCHQTVQPLARNRRLRIEPEQALGVDADLARVLALLGDPRLQDTVVCTHGEVIGQVLTWLVTDGLAVDQPLQWPKGSTWLLDGTNRRLTHARYLPPLLLAPAPSMASAPRGPVLGPDASSRPGV